MSLREVPMSVRGMHDTHTLTTRAQAPMVADCSCGATLVASGMADTPGVSWGESTDEYMESLAKSCAESGFYTWAEPKTYHITGQSAFEE